MRCIETYVSTILFFYLIQIRSSDEILQLIIIRGDVVTVECYEKLIKKDMIHPLTNKKLKEKDIIFMERVSTDNPTDLNI